jgi:hypothetical protein
MGPVMTDVVALLEACVLHWQWPHCLWRVRQCVFALSRPQTRHQNAPAVNKPENDDPSIVEPIAIATSAA